MKKILISLLIILNFIKIYANDPFLSSLKNSNSNSKTELLIYYKSDCPYCLKMENEINKDIRFQEKIKELYSIKLIDVSTIEGKENALVNNVTSVPFIIKTDFISNKKTLIKGFQSIEKLESDLSDENYSFKNSAANGMCGNGVIEDGEACDDGNNVSGDGCEINCTLTPICGNGVIEAGEACDDGNNVSDDGCESNCTLTPAVCGNGVIEAGEACDDGNPINGDGCESNCTLTPAVCGNGVIEAGETCDDGNNVNGDGCESNCTLTPAVCGNGVIEAGESCDDGNPVNGDGCESNCTLTPICGNGIVEAGETCDDGNNVNGDGCESNCTLTPICGNGIVEAGETCDDGNNVNGDGCESNCTLTLGVDELEINKSNILIVPNPTKNFIQIQNKLNLMETFTYKILDLTGRIVKIGNSMFNEQISIENLTNGNYIIQIEIKNREKLIKRLIKS